MKKYTMYLNWDGFHEEEVRSDEERRSHKVVKKGVLPLGDDLYTALQNASLR